MSLHSPNLYFDLPKPLQNIVKQMSKDGIRFNMCVRREERYVNTRWIEWEPVEYEYTNRFNHDEEFSSECLEEEIQRPESGIDATVLKQNYLEFKESFDYEFKDNYQEEYNNLEDSEDDSYEKSEQKRKLRLAYEKVTNLFNKVKEESAPKTKYLGKYDDLMRHRGSCTYQKDENEKYFISHTFDKKWDEPPESLYIVWYTSGGGCGCGCFTQRYPIRLYKHSYRAENFCVKLRNYLHAKNYKYDDPDDDKISVYKFNYNLETEQYTPENTSNWW